MLKYHTFYLINGLRLVFLGVDFQDAYCNNQSYTDGLRPIQVQKEGIDDSYYWDVDVQVWVEKRSLVIQENQALSNLDLLRTIIIQQLPIVSEIIIKEPNGNEFIISLGWSQWAVGWVNMIEMTYGEYEADEPVIIGDEVIEYDVMHEGYYNCLGTEYFHPTDIERVAEIFVGRLILDDRSKETGNGVTVDAILQHPSYESIYTNLTEPQELRLLGQLTLRLSQQEEPNADTKLLTAQVRHYANKLLADTDKHYEFTKLFGQPSLMIALPLLGLTAPGAII